MRVLDEPAVSARLHMATLIPAIGRALRALAAGSVVQPVRTIVPIAEHRGFLGSMPAYVDGHLGVKLVTFYPHATGPHTHHAVILMFDAATGAPQAMLDGRLITEMRTAAASAVATDALARRDAHVLAILGSGVQARSHLEAMRLVRDIRDVRVWSPRHAATFARDHGVHAAASAEAAVRGADIICVATSAQQPVLHGAWVAPGAHINAVGATRPDWRELDDALVARATLFVDSAEAATRESGDVIAALAAGRTATEIGTVAEGASTRRGADEVTLFKSVGVAVEDVASAVLVLGG
ncbi:MAG: hypothetical protein K1X31_08495 [Gemmatimonadaceae bacterium]|nr:hypothetical protein [Gemmatimonadaceae bacterium]